MPLPGYNPNSWDSWSVYHLNGIFGNFGENSNGTVHPGGKFSEKGNTFRGIFFFSLLPEFPKISVPFVHSYSARLFTVILPRKNAKDLKDGGRFPKRLSLECESLLVGSVGGRFRKQQQPRRWKRITFCGRYLCFLLFAWFGIPACFRLSYIVGKYVDADMLVFSDEMWMLQ